MIDYHCFCQIKDLHDHQGLNATQIASTLSLDPRTVAYWLRQERFRPRKSAPRPSKLDPFKAQIVQMLEKYPYSAAQVLQCLREQGFEGGYSTVKAYVRTVRPKRQPAFLTLAFAPGECAQGDWGSWGSVSGGQTSRRLRSLAWCCVTAACCTSSSPSRRPWSISSPATNMPLSALAGCQKPSWSTI